MPSPSFSVLRSTKQRGASLPEHTHDEAQLTFAASGMVQVHTAEGVWLVPSQLVAWIPAGVRHRWDVLTDAELWMVHWRPSAVRTWAPSVVLDRAFSLRVTPLLQNLLVAAVSADASPDKAELVVRLMLHELTDVQDAPTFLPLPTSPAGLRAADLALDDQQNRLTVEELASRAATSVRPHHQPAFPRRNRTDVQSLAPAGAHRASDGAADPRRRDRQGGYELRLRQHGRLLLRLPPGHRHDPDRLPPSTSPRFVTREASAAARGRANPRARPGVPERPFGRPVRFARYATPGLSSA